MLPARPHPLQGPQVNKIARQELNRGIALAGRPQPLEVCQAIETDLLEPHLAIQAQERLKRLRPQALARLCWSVSPAAIA